MNLGNLQHRDSENFPGTGIKPPSPKLSLVYATFMIPSLTARIMKIILECSWLNVCGRVGPPHDPAAGNAVEAMWWNRTFAHIAAENTHE